AAAFRAQAERSEVSLTATAASAAVVEGDPARLAAVLGNLVANALRHTPAGGSVTVSASGSAVTVADTGAGIDPELLPHVFDRFVRGAGGGSGLGLAIAKDVAEAHGGRISIESAPGRGTSVRLELPR